MKTINQLTNSTLFRGVLTVIVILFIIRSVWTLLPECTLLPNFCSPWFWLAVLLAFVYRIVNASGWKLVLQAMNQNVSGPQATRIWLHAESRRWLPGGVWGYASRATQAGKMNVPTGVASASMLIELLLTVAASIVIFLPVVVIYHREILGAVESWETHLSLTWIGVAVVAAVTALCILVRRKLANKVISLKQRLKLLQTVTLDKRRMFSALLFYVAMGCLNGLVTACLLWSISLSECPPLAVIMAATSLSWVIGFFAVFAPGGLFVREAAFATSLALWMPYSTGLALAILARVIQLGAEIFGMLWVWMTGVEPTLVTTHSPCEIDRIESRVRLYSR